MLAAKAQERLEGGHGRSAAVEAECELVEVGLKVGVADAVMSPQKPGLEVPEHAVDAGKDLARPVFGLGAGSPASRGGRSLPIRR